MVDSPAGTPCGPLTGPAARSAGYLRFVDARLGEVIVDLERVWRAERADGNVDLLGGRDLPDLVGALITSGKRFRPTMCYWGWLAAGVGTDSAAFGHVVDAGAALELLHVFALIHDDVMDESALRRGQPSVHSVAAQLHRHGGGRGSAQRFGESIAVLAGDLAHAEADHLAARLPTAMQTIWRRLVVQLVYGQSRDLTGTAAGRRDLGHARQVARAKSGGYTVERPLQLGAAAAGASEPVLACLAAYGAELGEAFALRDDLLGVWGDPVITGKPAGDDLISGKPTVILALAQPRLAGAAGQARDRVGRPDFSRADVTLLQRELEACGVLDDVETLITDHVRAAVDALDPDLLDPRGIEGLVDVANRIAWRNY